MTTPELRPEGANGGATGAIAIAIAATRIRNLAGDLPTKTANVDRQAAKIAEAAGAISEAARGAHLPETPPRLGAYEDEAVEIQTLWAAIAGRLADGKGDDATTFLRCVEFFETPVPETGLGPPAEIRVARFGATLIETMMSAGYDAPEDVAAMTGFAGAVSQMLHEALLGGALQPAEA